MRMRRLLPWQVVTKSGILRYVVSRSRRNGAFCNVQGDTNYQGGNGMSVDFAAVQWARRMTEALGGLRNLEPGDLSRLGPLVSGMLSLAEQGLSLSDAQLTVILQNTFNKTLTRLQADKGGVVVEFTGGGFEYERFLIRADGRVPNSRYEAKREM
jgi:hypothetical protein